MRLTVDRLRILLEHGLSEYQARVYLALLEFPSLPAGALAKAAQIPRNRLYEVLEELQGMGLIEIILGETRSYRAQPFTLYLERSVSELRDRMESLESKKAYLAAAFSPPELNESSDLDAGTTRVLLTRRAVAREIDRLIDGAGKSLVAVGSEGGWERILHHLSRYQGDPPPYPIEIMLPASAARSGGFERLGESFLPFVSWLSVPMKALCFAADEKEMLLIHGVPDDGRQRAGRDFALHTTNPAFVHDRLALVRGLARPALAPRAI